MSNSFEPTATPRSLVGQVVHGYQILELLGEGGMGEVYVARDVRLGVRRAFKVIHADVRSQSSAEARFQREAQAMARLSHPSILEVFDFGRMDDGSLYLVAQFVEGDELQRVVERSGPLPVADAVRVLLQIASALVHAHERDIVHRDLKPQNVLLAHGDPGQVRIIDFGLVKMVGEETMTKLTEDGHLLGSPLYMSPEQGQAVQVGAPADIYAVGGIGYFLLSGQPPFLAQGIPGLIYAHCFEQPARIEERCPNASIPPLVAELLFACLAKEPSSRPSAAGLLANLRAALEELASAPAAPAQLSQRATLPRPAFSGQSDDCARAEPSAENAASNGGGAKDASELIWSDVDLPRGADETGPMREALHNQITALLLRLAEVMKAGGLLEPQSERALARVRAIQEQIIDLEMELALEDARIEETPEQRSRADVEAREGVREEIQALQVRQRRDLRSLYASIRAQAANLDEPVSRSQLDMMDQLVDRYLSLSAS